MIHFSWKEKSKKTQHWQRNCKNQFGERLDEKWNVWSTQLSLQNSEEGKVWNGYKFTRILIYTKEKIIKKTISTNASIIIQHYKAKFEQKLDNHTNVTMNHSIRKDRELILQVFLIYHLLESSILLKRHAHVATIIAHIIVCLSNIRNIIINKLKNKTSYLHRWIAPKQNKIYSSLFCCCQLEFALNGSVSCEASFLPRRSKL